MKKKRTILPSFTMDEKGNTQIVFDSEHIKVWKKLKLIPVHLLEALYQDMQQNRMEQERCRKFKEEYPEASTEEMRKALWRIPKTLNADEFDKRLLHCKIQKVLHDFMVANWDQLLHPFQSPNTLFKDVDNSEGFAVARIEADPLYRLHDLLDCMKAIQVEEGEFKARGEVENSKGFSIVLEYDFKAKNQVEANERLKKYKKIMLTKGLRAFLAYWKEANLKGSSSFSCCISDVMGHCVEGRASYFNDEERSEFWGLTRALASTKFKLEWPLKKNPGRERRDKKGDKHRIEWIEQPLLQIHGGEKELGDECPTRMSCTVLTQKAAEARFSPALFSNKTLHLHPSYIHFAVVIQTRASQTGGEEISCDWRFTFKAANVEGQARTNPRAAKNLVRKKLGKFRETELIENWREDKSHVHITPQKKREIKN